MFIRKIIPFTLCSSACILVRGTVKLHLSSSLSFFYLPIPILMMMANPPLIYHADYFLKLFFTNAIQFPADHKLISLNQLLLKLRSSLKKGGNETFSSATILYKSILSRFAYELHSREQDVIVF